MQSGEVSYINESEGISKDNNGVDVVNSIQRMMISYKNITVKSHLHHHQETITEEEEKKTTFWWWLAARVVLCIHGPQAS